MSRLHLPAILSIGLVLAVCVQLYAQSGHVASEHQQGSARAGALKSETRGISTSPIAITVVSPPIDKAAAAEDAKERREDAANTAAMTWLTVLLVVIGAVQSCIFWYQAKVFEKQEGWLRSTVDQMKQASADAKAAIQVAQDANKITIDGLRATERAFVFLDRLEIIEANLRRGLVIIPVWKNSGSTPTRNMLARVSWMYYNVDIDPYHFQFPDIVRNGENYQDIQMGLNATRNLIGPGASISGEILIIPNLRDPLIERACKGNCHIYIWGWADYNDVFSNEANDRHRTEFCYKLNPLFAADDVNHIKNRRLEGDIPGTEGDIKKLISFELYRRHNGFDEECEGRRAYFPPL